MGMANINEKMAENIKVNITLIKNMGMEFIHEMMEENLKDHENLVNNMERQNILCPMVKLK